MSYTLPPLDKSSSRNAFLSGSQEFPAQIRPSVFSTEYFFFRMQIGIRFHFTPLSAQHPSTLKLHLEYKGASFERHFPRYKSPGKALLRTSSHFGPQPPPGQLVRRGPPNFV